MTERSVRSFSAPLRTHIPPAPASTIIRYEPKSPYLRVNFGQATFDAEGREAPGLYFSRAIHYPGGNSGVTIGRGYDMGQRSEEQVRRDLILAGAHEDEARILSRGAGFKGEPAKNFVRANRTSFPVISLEVQANLFEQVTAPKIVADIRRIFNKPDVVEAYGKATWESLPSSVKDFVFDLRYRGDYTPRSRQALQPLLVRGDIEGIKALAEDRSFWRTLNVPETRIEERIAMISGLSSGPLLEPNAAQTPQVMATGESMIESSRIPAQEMLPVHQILPNVALGWPTPSTLSTLGDEDTVFGGGDLGQKLQAAAELLEQVTNTIRLLANAFLSNMRH